MYRADNQMNQESANNSNNAESEQTVTESNKAVDEPKAQNDDNQPDQESNNENDSIDSIQEDCDNQIDDNANGLIDCADPQCFHASKCLATSYGVVYPEKPKTRQNLVAPASPDPHEVKKELSELNQKIQSTCHPEPGTLSVSFTLTPTGKVTNVKSKEGTLKGTEREICILKELKKYRFSSKGGRNIPVTYPFDFK